KVAARQLSVGGTGRAASHVCPTSEGNHAGGNFSGRLRNGGRSAIAHPVVQRSLAAGENCGRKRPRFGFGRGAWKQRRNCCECGKRIVRYRPTGQTNREGGRLGAHFRRRRWWLFP